MEPESGLIFKNMSSLPNLNLGTKFEFTLMFLHSKLIGKKIQQKLCLNDIVSIKPTSLTNWVISKTQPNLEVNHGLGTAK